MEQTHLFPPFQTHSNTSIDAAVAIESSTPTHRERVMAFIESCGVYGATDDEIQEALRMNPSTQRPRRIELQRQGKIKAISLTRRTRTGRRAAVWVKV